MSILRLSVVVLLLTVTVGLAATNPSTDDYLQFIETELAHALDRMDPSAPLKERTFLQTFMQSQGKKLVNGVIRPNTVRRNWVILSWFETRAVDVEVVVLGMAGSFLPIKGVEEARLKIGRLAF